MERRARLEEVLELWMSGGQRAAPRPAAGDDAFGLALDAIVACSQGRFDQSAVAARAALLLVDDAIDPDAGALVHAAAGLAVACSVDAVEDPVLCGEAADEAGLESARDAIDALSPELAAPILMLLAEASLACARVDLAASYLDRLDPLAPVFRDNPLAIDTFLMTLAARVRLFQGEVDAARVLADAAVDRAMTPLARLFALGAAAVAHGAADDRKYTHELLRAVAAGTNEPCDAVTRGVYVLAAYGAMNLGENARAAELMLRAGGDDDLSQLRIVDRALGLELLLQTAAASGDRAAADEWFERMSRIGHHRIASPAYLRCLTQWRLLQGDPEGAISAAESAITVTQTDGRAFESTQAELIAARARIAAQQPGPAAAALADLSERSGARGHLSVRRHAGRELRPLGRRLPPSPGSGWAGLSEREREVALLIAQGSSNTEIGAALFVSEATARIHVSRILRAFAVSSRAEIAAEVRLLAPGLPTDQAAPLTARQLEVVRLIAAGATNQEIATALGISVSTVEKHIRAVFARWQVHSRAGIVSRATTGGDEQKPA